MSQVLSFDITKNAKSMALLRDFPRLLQNDFHVKNVTGCCFEISSEDGEVALFQYSDSEASLEGHVDEVLYDHFSTLCDNTSATLRFEGEPLALEERPEENISILGTLGAVIIGLFSILLLFGSLLILPFRLLLALRKEK